MADEMIKTYSGMLIESLQKKKTLLEKLEGLTNSQSRLLALQDFDVEAFDEIITEKEQMILELQEIDEDLVSVVANATGIPSQNISFVAYEEMQFIDKTTESVDYKDVIQIVLIIIILGLLAFVVFMSLRTKKEVEEEEELSVEDLLQSTAQEELENIELEQKSEARKLIETFVEENPEAVATLLRNWLDEDWG